MSDVKVDNLIDAIKKLRAMPTMEPITLVPDSLYPNRYTLQGGVIGLKNAKDMVEAIMEFAINKAKEERRISSQVTPTYFTNGQKSGDVTHYTLSGAIQAAREDKSIERIVMNDCDGSSNTFYRNSRGQFFELDII